MINWLKNLFRRCDHDWSEPMMRNRWRSIGYRSGTSYKRYVDYVSTCKKCGKVRKTIN